MGSPLLRAVFWDFGGVFTSSPFDAFGRYEIEARLPPGLIRSINATDPDVNAWARLERSELTVDEFARCFEAEAEALGHAVDGLRVLDCLAGDLRPQMVRRARCRTRRAVVLVPDQQHQDRGRTWNGSVPRTGA